ncbi:MAG: hypothetical protein ACK5X6_05875 [Chryseotalea sp.]
MLTNQSTPTYSMGFVVALQNLERVCQQHAREKICLKSVKRKKKNHD